MKLVFKSFLIKADSQWRVLSKQQLDIHAGIQQTETFAITQNAKS